MTDKAKRCVLVQADYIEGLKTLARIRTSPEEVAKQVDAGAKALWEARPDFPKWSTLKQWEKHFTRVTVLLAFQAAGFVPKDLTAESLFGRPHRL